MCSVKDLCWKEAFFFFLFSENSTEIIGDPLEGVSVWFWNNTDLVSFLIIFNFTSFLFNFLEWKIFISA